VIEPVARTGRRIASQRTTPHREAFNLLQVTPRIHPADDQPHGQPSVYPTDQ
jgi:hypothetical protein